MSVIYIVIPCYNEEEALPTTVGMLSGKISALISKNLVSQKPSLLFIDDGSSDKTWSLIEKFHTENPLVLSGIRLPENRGHQNALLYGLLSVKSSADIAISIDADRSSIISIIISQRQQRKESRSSMLRSTWTRSAFSLVDGLC